MKSPVTLDNRCPVCRSLIGTIEVYAVHFLPVEEEEIVNFPPVEEEEIVNGGVVRFCSVCKTDWWTGIEGIWAASSRGHQFVNAEERFVGGDQPQR